MSDVDRWLRGGDVSGGGPQAQRTTSIRRLRRNRRRRGVPAPGPVVVVVKRVDYGRSSTEIVTDMGGENYGHGLRCPCAECRARG